MIKSSHNMKNEIIIYQPDETIHLEVRLSDNSVWLTQAQMAELFGCTARNVGLHLDNIYSSEELNSEGTRKDFFLVRSEGKRTVERKVTCYNLDAIISVGYRVNSKLGVKFRQWASQVLKDYLLKGYSLNHRLDLLESKIEKKFNEQDNRITKTEQDIDFFVRTSLPPRQGIFYDGQVFDADVFVTKFILSAKRSILLIDNYVDITTLEMLSKKRKGVSLKIVTSKRGNELAASDINKFNEQYGDLVVSFSSKFHDRFLIIDDKELFLIGASLKDLGKKCFAFTKLDESEIAGLKSRI